MWPPPRTRVRTRTPTTDEPVNVKSVETVSAMDLIMGAAEENAEKSEEDEGPVSA